jgi:glycosyltransferase involved in cell wall biosynthesis
MNNSVLGRSQPKTILHIAPITDKQVSGIAAVIPKLIRVLEGKGTKIALLTTAPGGRYENPLPCPVFYFAEFPRHSRIASLPSPYNCPDLIIFHSTYILSHISIAREAVQRGIPYIIQPHGGMTQGAQQIKHFKKKIGNILFFNRMVKHAAEIHCLTEMEARDVKHLWNKPVFVAGNGVDLPGIASLERPEPNKNLRFVFLGRLDIHHKGLDWLLEACHILQDKLRHAKVQVLLYGSEVADSRAKMQRLIDQYGIQDLVYIRDPVWGEEAKSVIFQGADVFLHTSRFEGHPVAVLEALSYGIPCLLTPGTNMAEEVEAARAGWAVDANPMAISVGIDRLLSIPTEIPLRGKAARILAQEKYSWIEIGKSTTKEYERIINEYYEVSKQK